MSDSRDLSELQESLLFLYVDELKNLCAQLELSLKGKKAELIHRIIIFVETGEKVVLSPYPLVSCSKGNKTGALTPDALMLRGAYKNDLKTRMFFKQLIGEYFHFTAFGIDWLDSRWMAGMPPTYQEFAAMWAKEYEIRKNVPALPKAEWAYINFVQGYLREHAHATKDDILHAWNAMRSEHKNYVESFFAHERNGNELHNNR